MYNFTMNWLRLWALFIYHANKFFDPRYKNTYYIDNRKQFFNTVMIFCFICIFSLYPFVLVLELAKPFNLSGNNIVVAFTFILYFSILLRRALISKRETRLLFYGASISLVMVLGQDYWSSLKEIDLLNQLNLNYYHIVMLVLFGLESCWLFVNYILPPIAKILLICINPCLIFFIKTANKVANQDNKPKTSLKPAEKDFKITGHKNQEERKLEDLL